jgi:hypothetical protein
MSGQWNVRLQILPEYGQGTYDSVWEVKQTGKNVNGSIKELASGQVTEFQDGYRGDSGSLSFAIDSRYQGKPAVIEVDVTAKDGKFEGLYDISIESEADEDARQLVMSGKLTGRKVAKKQNAKKSKTKNKKRAKAQESDNGTEILFDGSSMENFRGYKKEAIGKGWKIEDGTLHFDGTRSGDIISKKEYGSFELTFDWKVSPGGNCGVMYRVTLGDGAPYLSGIEYQILDNDKHADGKNRKTSAAAVYALYQAGDKHPKPVGQWNTSKIVVDGDKVQHWLNGDKVVETEIGSDDWNEKVAASKFAKWKKFGKSKRGHIAFQDHSDPVWYRNIKIKAKD